MYLFDLLFRLPPHVMVRVKFDGNPTPFCFTTGKKTTGESVARLSRAGMDAATVNEIIPLWHAQELYIRC